MRVNEEVGPVRRDRRTRSRVAWLALVAAAGCTTDHGRLARRAGGAGGAGGSAGRDATADVAGKDVATGDGFGAVDGSVAEVGGDSTPPAAVRRLTFVHGIVDADRIAFCFAVAGPGGSAPVGSPEPVGGVGFAGVWVTESLAGLDFETDAIETVVLAGDLSLLDGLDCAQSIALATASSRRAGADAAADVLPSAGDGSADVATPDATRDAPADASPDLAVDVLADRSSTVDARADAIDAPVEASAPDASDVTQPPVPAPLRARAMTVLPARTFVGHRSFLFVAAGCMGGPTFTAPSETALCGDEYRPDRPTLQPVLVAMSRKTVSNRLGLQVVDASVSTRFIEVRNVPEATGGEALIASSVVFGSIAPTPPKLKLTAQSYGLSDSELAVRLNGSTVPSFSVPWSDVLASSPVGSVADGRTYTLILVGPLPGIVAYSWWNGPTFAFVDNDPRARRQ